MKALIIGAAGFVGKYLIDHLIDEGWDVAATRLPSETIDTHVPVHELDILETDSIAALLEDTKPECIFHLAAQSSVAVSWEQPALTVDVNIKGAVNLLEAVRGMAKPARVLLIGSGEEYGYVLPEELPISEDTPLRPGNIYAATKIAQGMIGQVYAKAYGLEIVIVRAFNHAGPGQSDTFVLPNFCKQVAMIEAGLAPPVIEVGNLEAKRDFTDVRDIVKAYCLLAENGESGEIYNVGNGRAVAIEELLGIILSQTNADITIEQDKLRMRPSDVPVIEADISRICNHIGWKPDIPMESTIADILDEWRMRLSVITGKNEDPV